jgi:hypothetical protein
MINKNKVAAVSLFLGFLLVSYGNAGVVSAQSTDSSGADSKSGSASMSARSAKSTSNDSKPATKDPVVSVNPFKLAAQETDLVAPRSVFISAGYVTPGTFNSFAGTFGDYKFPGNIFLIGNASSSSGAIYKNSDRFLHNFSNPVNEGGNTFLGLNSGNFTMGGGISGFAGSYNTAIGYESLRSNTFGHSNTASGYRSLASNTIGNDNSALGKDSLTDNTSGTNNSAVGSGSLSNNVEGINNTAMGAFALLTNINGSDNTAIGMGSLYNNVADFNTAIGHGSLYRNTLGVRNTAVGDGALSDNTTGNGNTAIGAQAADNTALGLLTMSSTTFIGARANSSVDGITNSTAIGANAQVTKSNQVVIGNNSVTETVLKGNVSIGGRMCIWNGANYTLVRFAPSSIVPIYSTSTSC